MQDLRISGKYGAIPTPGGMLFFKNRDLAGKYLRNRVHTWQSTPEVHVLKGINLETGEPAGVAVGVNRYGVCVANTHVKSTPDVTYDLLCERLVQGAQVRGDVPRLVSDFMDHHIVQGGRILVASPAWSFLIEVLGSLFEIQEIEGCFAVTNHFSLISRPVEKAAADQASSTNRLLVASREIRAISSLHALKGLPRSHVPEKGGQSICNHRPDGGGTESSHIIQIQGKQITWSYLVGSPCENDYHMMQLFQGEHA